MRPIFCMARESNGWLRPMGVKSIAKHLNKADTRTQDGRR
jgi:hypothetical protein